MKFVLLLIHTACALQRPPFNDAAVSRRALAGRAASSLALAGSITNLAVLGAPVLALDGGDGLEYKVLTPPSDPGSPTPTRGQRVAIDYTLWLDGFGTGKVIDTSKGSAFPPKLPAPFIFAVGVGEVIPGWDKTVRTMRAGETRQLVVPPALGYGAKGIGPIPGGARLYFEMTLLEVAHNAWYAVSRVLQSGCAGWTNHRCEHAATTKSYGPSFASSNKRPSSTRSSSHGWRPTRRSELSKGEPTMPRGRRHCGPFGAIEKEPRVGHKKIKTHTSRNKQETDGGRHTAGV
jgi:hypothetical protein